MIIANRYTYSTYQWISSLIHIYDIQSNGFNDKTQPILIYPNSEQILFPWMNPSLIRLVCSIVGPSVTPTNLVLPVFFLEQFYIKRCILLRSMSGKKNHSSISCTARENPKIPSFWQISSSRFFDDFLSMAYRLSHSLVISTG